MALSLIFEYPTTAALALWLLFLCLTAYIGKYFWDVHHSPLNAAKDAHWSVKYTGAWIWWQRVADQDAHAVHEAHVRCGPVVRLAPKELSINDVDGGLKPIYDGRLPKTDFYDIAASYGEAPMVAIRGEKEHQVRKKHLARPYGKTLLTNSDGWTEQQEVLAKEFVQSIQKALESGLTVDLYDYFFAWSLATITCYIFGPDGCLNLISDIPGTRKFLESYFWQRTPQFLSAVIPIPSIIRKWTGHAEELAFIKELQEKVSDKPSQNNRDAWETVFSFMKSSMLRAQPKDATTNQGLDSKEEAMMSSELQDHVVAGIDTSTSALSACAWLLSLPRNRQWQDRLRAELHQNNTPGRYTHLEQLPVLDAIIQETLRLFPPAAAGQPRMTDKCIIAGPPEHEVTVPPGVKIHCQAQSIHRSSVFEDAEAFHPERWLDSPPEKRKEMERWFWAFGSGTRRCVGEHLGLSNIRVAMAALWSNFETTETEQTQLTMSKGLIAMPLPNKEGDFIRVRMEYIANRSK
jgi:hypothetical protein